MKLFYKKNIGLLSSDRTLPLTFGSDRKVLRDLLHFDFSKNFGRNENEDSYSNLEGNWIRLSFENNKLSEIELLRGSVLLDGIELIIGGQLDETLAALKAKGYSFKKGYYSYTDFNNLLDIGDSEDNGAVPNKIHWFYTATNFDHLLE